MSNKRYYIWSVLLGLLLMTGCKSVQQANTAAAKKQSVGFLLKKIEQNQIDYTWFGCKSKVKFEQGEEKVSATAKIRIQKDSLIWVSISKMNIEGARIKITPETIEILDRQSSEYIRKPFTAIENDYGVKLSFSELQDLLIGNPILWSQTDWISAIEEEKHVLRTPKTQKEVLKIFLTAKDYLLAELRGSVDNNSISIVYSDYQEIGQQNIAHQKDIIIDSQERGLLLLTLTFNDIELNVPQKVRFTIPDTYK